MPSCDGCRNGSGLDFDLKIAFQPIFDCEADVPFAYEALVRGPHGESARWVLDQIHDGNRYAFDQECRVAAIRTAVAAGLLDGPAKLSINFMPNAVYSPQACIQLTLKTASETGLPTDRLIFEFTENEQVDTAHARDIIDAYAALGFATAVDDFGAGYSGLGLLANLKTDIIKLDMELIRGIDVSEPRRQIVRATVSLLREMGRVVVAEGIETASELEVLRDLGVRYVQGFHIAKPMLGAFPPVDLGRDRLGRAAAA